MNLQSLLFDSSKSVKMMRGYNMIILLAFLIDGVFSADVVPVTVMEGDSVPLNTDVPKQNHDTMRWYFNDTVIAQINGDPSKNCLYDGEGGRFRDRLKVDYESGSLTITNIRPEHAGRYEADLIGGKNSGNSQSLNRNRKCDSTKIIRKPSNTDYIIKTFSVTVSDTRKDLKEPETNKSSGPSSSVPGSGLSAGAVAGIVVVLLVSAAAAGVIYYRHRISRKDAEIRKQQLL